MERINYYDIRDVKIYGKEWCMKNKLKTSSVLCSVLVYIFLPLLTLSTISCNDDNSNCPTEPINLLNSACVAETIYSPCNFWQCRNSENPVDEFPLNFDLFECEVIDCGFLRCTNIETGVLTDFTNITPLSEFGFSTTLNSDAGEEFDCGLVQP